jgi:pimeloyl-ACP methyl ester carboxylesterase
MNTGIAGDIAAIAPVWFAGAIAHAGVSRWAESAGTRLHYLAWNEEATQLPPLLLVHGFGGHAHWWDGIAPLLAGTHRVYAMDLSGMGDSDRREHYTMRQHSVDILAVIECIAAGPVIAVAHSYGGGRLFRACADAPQLFARAIVLDSAVAFDGRKPSGRFGSNASQPYPDFATALARFRLVPDQPSLPYVFDHVAQHSLRPVEGGWTWKFDPRIFDGERDEGIAALLPRIAVPVDYVYGELSRVVSGEHARRIASTLRQGRIVEVPQAGHHLMLDQPLPLVTALRALLA